MSGPPRAGSDLYVFRDARRRVSVEALYLELAAELAALARASSGTRRLAESAALRAGELEAILADACAAGAPEMAACTDALADLAWGERASPVRPPALADGVMRALGEVAVSPPEGFAYYALQPSSFARLAHGLPVPHGRAAVIGLRSIGTTLSAIVAASLRRRGVLATRTTVRPTGHPYDRHVELTAAQGRWIRRARDRDAAFFVVDEGPGMSGSSLLSAAEAVVRAGVEAKRVIVLCTRAVDPAMLYAPDAGRRFAAFGAVVVAPPALPPDGAATDVSAGAWRARFLEDEAGWPATWPAMERCKALSADGRWLFKFEGLGRWGAAVRERARAIADAGFGPSPSDAGGGFVAYPVIEGRSLSRERTPRGRMLARLAEYCAFRATAFPVDDANGGEMAEMLGHDAEQLLGEDVDASLPLERPVVPDARLSPHEWIEGDDGRLYKTDGASHGDDHLFPGPTDIAWDLAGAIVEWQLDEAAREELLALYARASGDRADARLPPYLRAYAIAQIARCEMAAGALEGTREADRLLADARRYRRALARALP